MKLSLITVTYNAAAHLRTCIDSVLAQSYPDLEYIIVDGGSTDATAEIVQSYGGWIDVFLSEPDEGLYDAMNKGIALATGEVVGLLNADDCYASPQVLTMVMEQFATNPVDTVFGDLVYVPENDLERVVRYFPGRGFHHEQMRRGLMPPHPTFFARRSLYHQYGHFDTRYQICADFDLMVRWFHRHGVGYHYLPEVLVKMRTGGSSTRGLRSTVRINREMLQSLRENGVPSSLPRIYSKYLRKAWQLVQRPASGEEVQ